MISDWWFDLPAGGPEGMFTRWVKCFQFCRAVWLANLRSVALFIEKNQADFVIDFICRLGRRLAAARFRQRGEQRARGQRLGLSWNAEKTPEMG